MQVFLKYECSIPVIILKCNCYISWTSKVNYAYRNSFPVWNRVELSEEGFLVRVDIFHLCEVIFTSIVFLGFLCFSIPGSSWARYEKRICTYQVMNSFFTPPGEGAQCCRKHRKPLLPTPGRSLQGSMAGTGWVPVARVL